MNNISEPDKKPDSLPAKPRIFLNPMSDITKEEVPIPCLTYPLATIIGKVLINLDDDDDNNDEDANVNEFKCAHNF